MSTNEKLRHLAEILRGWQHIENRSVAQTADIIDCTPNPVIRTVMQIIQHDSMMHHRVQQFILDTIEKKAVTLSVDDLSQVWDAIETHIESERRVGELAAAALESIAGTKDVVAQYLLSYLAQDEKKHDDLLDNLALIKRGMYRSV
jgi:hypothetical protein